MNVPVNDCFVHGWIAFISDGAVPSFGFKLVDEELYNSDAGHKYVSDIEGYIRCMRRIISVILTKMQSIRIILVACSG